MKTEEFFQATKAQDLKTKSGALKMAQIVCMLDAMLCVHTCCAHAFHGHDMPQCFKETLEYVRKPSEMSLARIRQIFALWYKWTYGETVPSLSRVQSFLWAVKKLI